MQITNPLTPKRADVQNLDDVQKKLFQYTEKAIFHPSKFFLLFLCWFSNTCIVQIFQTTFYDFPINLRLKESHVSFIVQNLAFKNEPHIFHRKIFFENFER